MSDPGLFLRGDEFMKKNSGKEEMHTTNLCFGGFIEEQ